MNRHHAYINGHSASPRGGGELSMSPHRFQPRSQPLRKRKQLLTRLGVFGGISFILSLMLFPSFRSALYPSIPFGMGSGIEDLQLETVRYYDLSDVGGTARGWEHEERVLLCAPLRDAESHLPMFFAHLRNFTYPHHLIDLAFLVSDSKDNTLTLLNKLLTDLQVDPDPRQPYGEISILEKDFGQKVNQDVESRHGFAAQASRRKLMAQARNWLLSAALRPTHSWVYWRDVDVETAPFTILEDLMRHNKEVIVPNVWRPLPDWLGGEQPYDLNSWQESETALALADTLDEDAVIVEGYAEYATWRPHLAYLRDPYGDPDMEMEIDGVGGVSILAKAKVFRSGVHFPAFSFEKHAETEGFGKMAKRMGFSVVGLPHYTVWHLYEPSVDDIRHMQEMEQERKNRENEERERAERMKKIKEEFNDPESQWKKDKNDIEGITVKDKETKKGPEEGDSRPAAHSEKSTSEEIRTEGNEKVAKVDEPSDAGSEEPSKGARKPETLLGDEDTEPRRKQPASKATDREASTEREPLDKSSVSEPDFEAEKIDTRKKSASAKKAASAAEPGGPAQGPRPKKISTNTGNDKPGSGKEPARRAKTEERPERAKSEKIVKADKGM